MSDHPDVITAAAQGRLRTFIERIERLEEDKAAVQGDLKDVYAEAKGEGYDTKIMRKVVALRKKDPQKLAEEESLLDLYLSAIGDLRLPFEPAQLEPKKREPSTIEKGIAATLFNKAVDFVRAQGECVPAALQGHLMIDAGSVGILIEAMVAANVVGPARGKSKRRDVKPPEEQTQHYSVEEALGLKGITGISVHTTPPTSIDTDLYEQVKAWMIENRKPNVAAIQRAFTIGYNKAATLMDKLEADGIVSPVSFNGHGTSQRHMLTGSPL